MSDGNEHDPTLDTNELDAGVLERARALADSRGGKEVGEVSDDEIDRILSDDGEKGDHTRELDLKAFREKLAGS